MNIFFIYMLLVSVLVSIVLFVTMKLSSYRDDKQRLLDFVEEYGYLASRFDVISLYVDLQIRDPNDGIGRQLDKWRCVSHPPTADNSFVIASEKGYMSNSSFDTSLFFASESQCIHALFSEYETGVLNLHPIYNPCVTKGTIECQTLLTSLQ